MPKKTGAVVQTIKSEHKPAQMKAFSFILKFVSLSAMEMYLLFTTSLYYLISGKSKLITYLINNISYNNEYIFSYHLLLLMSNTMHK